jgi:glycine hydroxymethyltransferase
MHVVAAKAVAFGEALKPSFKAYIRQVVNNCRVLGEELVAAGLRLVSGGTDTHLVLVDVTPFGLGGKQAEAALEAAGITCNKNMIPYDPRPAMDPSGIRLGTPALTTRGMKEAEMKQIAKWIGQALRKHDDPAELVRIRHEVQELTAQYPLHNAEAFV